MRCNSGLPRFAKEKILALALAVLFVASLGFAMAQTATTVTQSSAVTFPASSDVQFTEPSAESFYSTYDQEAFWPALSDMNNGKCEAGQDFVVMIPPAGCSPDVVRSDLLASQNVPVFCQLSALKINPLVDVSAIDSIAFQGSYPKEVGNIIFHPARAAVASERNLLNSPLTNNIGYVVIILKKQANEKQQPKFVAGNLTATLTYNAEKAYGVGNADYYSSVVSDEAWLKENKYAENSFWNGKGFIRVTDISASGDAATVKLYTDKNTPYTTLNLKTGQTSDLLYFPGFYCKAGLRVTLNDISSFEQQAKLNIDGNEVWVRKGQSFLNNKCSIADMQINSSDNTGFIVVSCSGNKQFTLQLRKVGASGGVNVVSETAPSSTSSTGPYTLVGSEIYYNGQSTRWILSGSRIYGNEALGGKEFATIDDNGNIIEDETNLLSSSEWETFIANYQIVGGKIIKKATSSTTGSAILTGNAIIDEKSDKKYSSESGYEDIDNYFLASDKIVKNAVENFPLESDAIKVYSEENLWEQALLAKKLQKFATEKSYLELFLQKYPGSSKVIIVNKRLKNLEDFDYGLANNVVKIGNNYNFIELEEFDSGLGKKKEIRLEVGGVVGTYNENKEISLTAGAYPEKLFINTIAPNSVSIMHSYYSDKKIVSENLNVGLNQQLIVAGKKVVLKEINVEEVAHLSLQADVPGATSKANFTFKIGVEPRNIQLSTGQTKNMLKNLNQSIKDWESKNEKLRNLIKGWNGACLVTSGALLLKNLAEGFSGEGMARTEVMKTYKAQCANIVASKTSIEGTVPSTQTECYNLLSKNIDADVSAMAKSIKETNDEIKPIENKYKQNTGLLGTDKVVDQDKALKAYQDTFANKISVNGQNISAGDVNNWDALREARLQEKLKANGASDDLIRAEKNKVDDLFKPLLESAQQKEDLTKVGSDLKTSGILNVDEKSLDKVAGGITYLGAESLDNSGAWSKLTAKNFSARGMDESVNTPMQIVRSGTNTYAVALEDAGDNRLITKSVYQIEGKTATKLDSANSKDAALISNKYFVKEPTCNSYQWNDPKVQYYETGTNEKLPAIVPIPGYDKKGFYAKIPESGGGIFSGSVSGYKASGDISFFYICNVGPNGIMDNCAGDDIRQSFNVNTFSESDQEFCSLSGSETRTLYNAARKAVQSAAQQYGNKEIKLGGETFLLGNPMGAAGEMFECQDFMSPSDCKWLFNACDPVICPSSRCNLGGKYPVADVVQTGIIGSIVLCLPNWNEGVYVPICLTGLNAGLESYISLLKSERDCLQKSLDTGEMVGICDEITAIGKCEFFWRQLSPFVSELVPKIVNWFSTGGLQGARGGGEYLSIKSNWDNSKKGVEYFKNTYAANFMRAFQLRNVEEAGGTVCRAFVGTSFPTSSKLLDNLLTPESPSQFYAWFSEAAYSDATLPATSFYKVYYHIFAGNDQGTYYSVYLTNPAQSSYYQIQQEVLIKSGYIAKGQAADEAIEKTLPSGYKELCVVIGAKRECGFKQVSTSFGLDWLNTKYVEQQNNTVNIASEKECISGTPSAYYLANPNLQAGIEETVNPDISLRGITRVCSDKNPGQTTQPGRWVAVGNCGDKNSICWLDTQSTSEELNKLSNINAGLATINKEASSIIDSNNTYQTFDEFTSNLNVLKDKVKELNTATSVSSYDVDSIAGNLTNLYEKTPSNKYRAEILFLKAETYRIAITKLANNYFLEHPLEASTGTGTSAKATPVATTIVLSGGYLVSGEDIRINDASKNYPKTNLFVRNSAIYFDGILWNNPKVADIDNNGKIKVTSDLSSQSADTQKYMNDLAKNYIYNSGHGQFEKLSPSNTCSIGNLVFNVTTSSGAMQSYSSAGSLGLQYFTISKKVELFPVLTSGCVDTKTTFEVFDSSSNRISLKKGTKTEVESYLLDLAKDKAHTGSYFISIYAYDSENKGALRNFAFKLEIPGGTAVEKV